MGRPYAAFLALATHSAGWYIFGPSPYLDIEDKLKVPSIIFSTGIFVLAAYGKAINNLFHRPSPWPLQIILQFLGAAYIIELMQATMWLPLQDVFVKQIPAMANRLQRECDQGGSIPVCVVYSILEWITLICVADSFPLVLSIIFLTCCLHMTDVINLEVLWSCPKRLIALLVQCLMKCIGMKNLVCEADTTNLCSPSVAGGSSGGGAGGKPARRSPLRTTPSPQGTPQPPSSPKRPLPKLPRCDSPSESPSRRAGASWTRKNNVD